MPTYHAKFCILGEVIEMFRFQEPAQRLLIDISAHPGPDQDTPEFVYRTSFSVIDPTLIHDLQDRVSPGDTIEATGTFWQTGYVQHQTGYIDTTFRLTGFQLIRKQAAPAVRNNPYQGLSAYLNMH